PLLHPPSFPTRRSSDLATLEEAVKEAIGIGEETGVPVQISHVKAAGRENWGKMDRVLRTIDAARARGLDVTGDVYPYPAGSTKIDRKSTRLNSSHDQIS